MQRLTALEKVKRGPTGAFEGVNREKNAPYEEEKKCCLTNVVKLDCLSRYVIRIMQVNKNDDKIREFHFELLPFSQDLTPSDVYLFADLN